MPAITFEKVLKIISTVLNILVAALSAITGSDKQDINPDE